MDNNKTEQSLPIQRSRTAMKQPRQHFLLTDHTSDLQHEYLSVVDLLPFLESSDRNPDISSL